MLLVVSLRHPAAQFPDGDLLPCIYGWQYLATQPSASIQKGEKQAAPYTLIKQWEERDRK